MPAICRTKVAVIGRTSGDAGRNTVWTSGAIARVHAGHLHFIIEVRGVAHAPDQERRANPPRRRHHEIAERVQTISQPALRPIGVQISSSMARRSSAENSGALPG